MFMLKIRFVFSCILTYGEYMQLTCYLKNQAALPSNMLSLSNEPHFRKLLQNLSLNMRLALYVMCSCVRQWSNRCRVTQGQRTYRAIYWCQRNLILSANQFRSWLKCNVIFVRILRLEPKQKLSESPTYSIEASLFFFFNESTHFS